MARLMHWQRLIGSFLQVELMKDKLEEAEEQTALVTKELSEKSREFELLKRQHIDAQRAVQLLQVKSYTYL